MHIPNPKSLAAGFGCFCLAMGKSLAELLAAKKAHGVKPTVQTLDSSGAEYFGVNDVCCHCCGCSCSCCCGGGGGGGGGAESKKTQCNHLRKRPAARRRPAASGSVCFHRASPAPEPASEPSEPERQPTPGSTYPVLKLSLNK